MRRREANKRKAKRAGKKIEAVRLELHQAALFAAGASIYERAEDAAEWAGLLGLSGRQLADLQARANELHADILSGDIEALKNRGLALQHLIQTQLISAVLKGDVSPRDLPHVQRASAQAVEITASANKGARFANMQLFVVGYDGKPFDPNSVPQVDLPDDEETSP